MLTHPAALFLLGVVSMLLAAPVASRTYRWLHELSARRAAGNRFLFSPVLTIFIPIMVGTALVLAPLALFGMLPLRQNGQTCAYALLTGFTLYRGWRWLRSKKVQSARTAELLPSISVEIEERKSENASKANEA